VAGQVVLVSGGSRGIGRALAAGFASAGPSRHHGSEAATLEKTATEISTGDNPCSAVCDVAQLADIAGLTATGDEKFGGSDTLVTWRSPTNARKLRHFLPDEYDFILNINLRGCSLLSQAVGKQNDRAESGAIIKHRLAQYRFTFKECCLTPSAKPVSA